MMNIFLSNITAAKVFARTVLCEKIAVVSKKNVSKVIAMVVMVNTCLSDGFSVFRLLFRRFKPFIFGHWENLRQKQPLFRNGCFEIKFWKISSFLPENWGCVAATHVIVTEAKVLFSPLSNLTAG